MAAANSSSSSGGSPRPLASSAATVALHHQHSQRQQQVQAQQHLLRQQQQRKLQQQQQQKQQRMHADLEESEEKPLLADGGPAGTGSRGNAGVGAGAGGAGAAEKPAAYSRMAVFLIFLFPALGGLLFGYDIGATSAVLPQLESAKYSGTSWHSTVANSSVLQGVITSLGVGGAMLGSMICFQVSEVLGRRRELIIASFLFVVGAAFEALSGTSSWSAGLGITTLLFGRLVYGTACGFAMHGAPSYIAEMAPASIRGLLVSLKEGFIVVGMLLGYTVGYLYEAKEGGWRSTYAVSIIFAVAMSAGMSYLPPSARWLVLRGRVTDARRSMRFVTPALSESALAEIRDAAKRAGNSEAHGGNDSWANDWGRLMSPTCKPALICGVGLVLLQQVTGQPSVLYYADSIFTDVGLDMAASIGVASFKLVATLLAVFTVDNFGRKKLLYAGCTLMLIALIILTIAFMFPYVSESMCNDYDSSSQCGSTSKCSWDDGCGSNCTASGYDDDSCECCGVSGIDGQKAAILAAMFLYIGGYQVGFGPIAWLMISELFPLEVRGKAISVAVVANFFSNMVVSLVFPSELEYIGSAASFLIFALLDAYAIYFIWKRVPETKGLTLEQIENFFMRASAVGGMGGIGSTGR